MKKTILLLALALAACSHLPSWLGGAAPKIEKIPGERLAVIGDERALSPDPTLAAVPVKLPDGQPLGALDKTTSAAIGEGEEFERAVAPPPVVAAGMVFAMDAAGNISAHEAANIENIRWQSAGLAEEDSPEALGGGLAYHQGRIYATSGRGWVGAFDAETGKEMWKKQIPASFRSAPRLAGGILFAITLDSQLLALDAASGEVRWAHRGISETAGLMSAAAPAITGSVVIAPYASGEIYALAAESGQPLWGDSLAAAARTEASAGLSGIVGDPVIDAQVVIAASASGRLGVFAIATGQRLWDLPVSSLNAPWLAGDYLFVLTAGNQLVCLVKYTGQVRWVAPLPRFDDEERKIYPILWRGPVVAGGKVVVAGSNEELRLFSAADGSLLETKSAPGDIAAAPVIAGGRMYLIGRDATLYAVE